MAFNIENFNAFQDTAGEFTGSLDRELSSLATSIVDQMRRDAPVARQNGGALRNSIKINIDRNKFIIDMLKYGPYQNYGVLGAALGGPTKDVVEDEMTGRKHQFGTQFEMIGGSLPFGARVNIHRFGINRQPFYNVEDIVEQMVETILQIDLD